MHKIYFTPGPSQLFYTVPEHIKSALKNDFCAISHRSSTFKNVYQEAEQNLRELLGVPDDFFVLFTSSATEIWERLYQNLVTKSSLHLVNGEFSGRFYEFGKALNFEAQKQDFLPGTGIEFDNVLAQSPLEPELLALTHNETSTGASMAMTDFIKFRQKFPNAIIAIDAVSSIPYPKFDFSTFDSLYFSVQKGIGLPAGLGVWMVNRRCLERAINLKNTGKSIGTLRALPEMVKKAQEFQTVETPNMLGIYLLAKVSKDMLMKGMDMIRRETDYKAAVLEHFVSQATPFNYFVNDKNFRSKTVHVIEVDGEGSAWIDKLDKKGMVLGAGYGPYKNRHIRIANFPTHSKEQFELLVDTLNSLI